MHLYLFKFLLVCTERLIGLSFKYIAENVAETLELLFRFGIKLDSVFYRTVFYKYSRFVGQAPNGVQLRENAPDQVQLFWARMCIFVFLIV